MKNNTLIVISVIGVVAFAVLFYFGGEDKSSVSNSAIDNVNTVVDPHDHSTTVNTSSGLLNNLVDKPAPNFSFSDRDGKVYSQDTLRGKNTILFFNEGLMCYPACWNQIVAFSKDDRFKNDDIVTLSVVVDSKESWQQAIDKMPELAQATVVFDNGASVSKAFGALSLSSSMHPGSLPGHTYAVIDKEGIVRYVFDDPNMGIRNDQLMEEIAKFN